MNETRAASRPTPGTASCLKPVTAALAGAGFVAMLLAPVPFAVAAEATPAVFAREMDRGPWHVAQAAPAASVNDSAAIGLRPFLAQAKVTQTFTVTNTNASGAGSLSDAISQANSFGCYGNDSIINFGIAGPGPHVIATSAGFSIDCPTVIDGYSQSGSSANTVADARNGTNALPLIVIDGSSMTGGNLLSINSGATGSVVRGLVLKAAPSGASAIYNFAQSVLIAGNFIGTDQTGAACGSLSGPGIQLDFNATGAMIGSAAAADRNVIGCAFPAIAINGTTNIQVKGNLIGAGPNGLQPIPNSHGITTSNSFMSVSVGGQGPGEGNVIANNTGSGVYLFSNTSGIVVSGSDIFLNGLLGIDQGGDGVPMTPNTFTFPSGSNGSQNYPTIASVTYAGGSTTISGTLHGFWNSNNVLEYFSNDGTLGLDEGSRYAGTSGVSIVSTTPVPFTATIPAIVRNPTATARASSGTSEFSPAFLTPDMTPSTSTVNFPATALGSVSAIVPLSIQNTGLGSLVIDSISNTLSGDFFDTTGGPPPSSAHYCGVGSDSTGAPLSGSSISIAPSASCVLNLAFRPQASGARSATLTFNDAGSPNNSVVVTLAGTGGTLIPLPTTVSFSPTSLTLPGPVPAFSTLGITVGNPNGAPAQGLSFTQTLPSNLVIAPTPNATVVGASCSGSFLSLVPGASSFTVDSLFVPTSGACDVVIDVTSNTAGSYPVSVPAGAITGTVLSQAVSNALSNTGTLAVNAASLLISPPSPVNFGTVFLGSSAPVSVTLTNTGAAPLNFSAPLAVTGANPADFTFTDTCVPDPLPQLAPGNSCTVNITFTPAAIGARAASMSFASNTLTSPDVLNLAGSGSAVPVPVVSLTPPSMFFPAQTVGTTSSPQVATLTNIGTAPLNISSITSTGDFAQSSTCGTSLAQTASCTISVTFTPLITGLRTGDVKVFDDASGSPHAIILDGDGVAPPVPTVTAPSTVSFPTTQVGGSSSAIDISIGNSGGAPLVISAAELVGTGFVKVADGCSGASITPSSSCVVSIVFAPTTSGAISATLRILSNAPTSPNFVGLTGQATVAPIASLSASPGSLVFAEQVVDTTSPAQTVTVTNTGGAAATVSGVTVTGDYAQTNNCATVNAGESCTITVTFTPTGTGSRPGSIVVAGNASNAPLTIALSGSAAPPPLPVIELSVSSLTYGNTLTGAGSATQAVTLRNVGGSPLTIASLRLAGEFRVSNGCPTVVPAGGSCRIDVGFAPTVPGPRTGRLDVLSDASNGTKGVDLGGTGCRFSFLNRNYTLFCQ